MSSDHKQVDPNAASGKKPKDNSPQFDADLSPRNPQNKQAAAAEGLKYSRGSYRDVSGAMIRDRYGQPY